MARPARPPVHEAVSGAGRAVLPAGELPAGAVASGMAGMAGHSIALALQLAAPFVLAAMLFNAALGLLARLAPQSQVFVVATPVQVLGGILLLGLLLPILLGAVGISGDASAKDEECCIAAIEAAGLVADHGDPA